MIEMKYGALVNCKDLDMDNRTEPKTLSQWIRYLVVAAIALWLVVWMLRISGIDIL